MRIKCIKTAEGVLVKATEAQLADAAVEKFDVEMDPLPLAPLTR